ncbi:hypothetical protein D3C74_428810 [compost metagenome]
MFDFTEPSRQTPALFPKAAFNASSSIGSPNTVPVPCVSTNWIDAADTSASCWAVCMTSACPSTLGAVKALLRFPSLLIADPLITA